MLNVFAIPLSYYLIIQQIIILCERGSLILTKTINYVDMETNFDGAQILAVAKHYNNIFMRRDYNKLQENSNDGSGHEVELNPSIDKQFIRSRPRNAKISNEGAIAMQSEKLKDMKSIYLDGLSSRNPEKSKSQKVQSSKVNADELIKVLQNGRERRDLRRKKNEDFDKKVEESVELERHNSKISDRMSEHESKSQMTSPYNNLNAVKAFDPPDNELKIRKVLREMKDEDSRISKLKQQTQWKQIQSLLVNKAQVESPVNQKDRKKRRQQLEAAKELLTGKVSIIWIFIVSGPINQDDKLRITKMYSGLADVPYIVPLCKRAEEIKTFLDVPNSHFKIVADLANFGKALQWRINNKVVEYYVYNDLGEKGIARALSYKSQTRKVKGIYNSLGKIIDRAEQQIQNQVQLYQTKKGLTKKNNFKKFPSFIKLSGQDKTYATLYRANLYGSKNVVKSELQTHYQQFMNLVQEKYGSLDYEKTNISDYEKLNHFEKDFGITVARQVIKFYVRQSFYYQILNSMLRTMKTTEQFKPCIFPFYENYHAVKKLYSLDLQESNRKINAQTVYRGARLRPRDFLSLKPGIFIEMLGFMSTSKNLERAKQFCDRDGYIFVVTIPQMTILQKFSKYDHGFVDINKHKLASKQFSVEEEILFNALNVFKVTKITMDGARHMIHMQYGPIFDLLVKDKDKLTSDEKDVLMNYQYCSHMQEEIEDQGDVLLLANQYDESKFYYQEKLNQNKDGQQGKYYYKLANVQQQCGELDEANKNVQISLKIQLENIDLNDREKCLKVFSIHSKNAEISLDQEDYLTADEAITNAIEMLSEDNEFEKAKKLRERGQIKFKKGEIIDAEKDFEMSENIFKSLTNKANEKRKTINRGYYFSFIALLCSSNTQQDLHQERQSKLKEIDELQKQIKNMEETINDELIKVNGSLKQVANYAEDKEKYQICVKKARAYLLGVQSRKTNDPIEKAKLKALEATIQDYLQIAESEKLLYEAIALVQSNEPFNPNVGKYSQILGVLQKKQLEKFSNPKVLLQTPLTRGMEPIKYNKQQHKGVYERCKKNFQKAINVLLYNNKTKSSPQIVNLKNNLGELDFYESKFESSQKIIKEAKQSCHNQAGHSEVSRSSLLLSKIAYARGQLKDSFENVSEAFKTLRTVVVKKQQTKYISIFESNNLLLQIKLQRAKVYHKQLSHDLSLKDINQIKQAIQKKIDQKDNHSMLADLCEIRAENNIAKFGTFGDEFQKAIKLREKQIGEYNLANAVTLCNYAKYLILTNDFNDAQKKLHKAVQIFSCFSEEHPITWLALYCAGLLHEKKQHNEDAVRYIKTSLLKVKQKYDKDHITVNKVRLQYAKALHRAGRIQQAIKQFEQLDVDLQHELNASLSRSTITNEKDDEKITIKRFLYQSLRESYKELNRLDVSNLNATSRAIDICEKKMDNLKKSFKMEIKDKQQD